MPTLLQEAGYTLSTWERDLEMDTETFSLPQVLPLDFSKCHSHRGTFSSVLPSIASLSFQTKLHVLPQEVSPTHPCPRGLIFYQPFDYTFRGLAGDSCVSLGRARAQFPLLA